MRVAPTSVSRRARRGPLTGVPVAHKDIFCTRRHPAPPAASRMLSNFVAPYDATVVRALGGGRHRAARQDQHGRVRDGLVERDQLLRPGPQPLGPDRVPGGSSGGSAAAVAACLAPAATRHRHGRLDPPAGGAVRHHGPQAHLRPRVPLRHDRLRLEPRPGGRAHAHGGGRGAAARRRWPASTRATRPAWTRRCPTTWPGSPRRSTGLRVGVPREFFDEGLEPRRRRGSCRSAIEVLRGNGAACAR